MTRYPNSGTVWMSVLASIVIASTGLIAASFLNRTPSEDTILAGKRLFEHEYTENDPLCGEGDGLGPVFNERSCVACHFVGGVGGSGTNEFNVTSFEAFPVPGRSAIAGGAVHMYATKKPYQEEVDQLEVKFPTAALPVGSVIFPAPPPRTQSYSSECGSPPPPPEPIFTRQTRDFDPLHVDEINTPALFGLGEIEKISNAAITMHGAKRSFSKVSKEFTGDFSGSGVGRLRIGSRNRVGKFGWKGQFATVDEFVANACAMELGLTNPRVKQPIPREYTPDEDAKLDMTKKQLYQLVSFVKSLPAPKQILPDHPTLRQQALLGEQLFNKIGCADCHVPDIGGVEGVYSDFHLYEVEHESKIEDYVEPNFSPEFTLPFEHPRPSEWQTPPLWGVADSAPYFHDGQSTTLESAINRHGRDGAYARTNFHELTSDERLAVIEFLRSLRAPLLE